MSIDASARVWSSGLLGISPVGYSLQYLTAIKEWQNGVEQRRAHRDRPRRFLRFEIAHGGGLGDTFRKVLRDLHGYHDALWAVPNWYRRQLTTTTLAAAGNTVDVDAVNDRFMVIGETVILAHGGRYERRDIQNIAGSTLTFVEVNGADPWPVGTRVYEALPASLPAELQIQKSHRNRLRFDVPFEVDPGGGVYVEPPAAPVTFNGREVLTYFPMRSDPIEFTLNSHVSRVDYQYGRVARRRRVNFLTEIHRLSIPACTPARSQLIEDVFVRARGQAGEFYMPTWDDDFRVTATAGTGTNTLQVEGVDVEPVYSGSIVHNAIAIKFTDNTWEFNIVTGMTTGATETTLTLLNNWSRDIDPSGVRLVGWMPLCRFASDTLNSEFNFKGRFGEVLPVVQTLPNPDVQQGVGAAALPVPVLSGAANQVMDAQGAISTPVPLIGAGGKVVEIAGQGAINSPMPELSAMGTIIKIGAGNINVPIPTLDGAANFLIDGDGVVSTSLPILSGYGFALAIGVDRVGFGSVIAPVPVISGVANTFTMQGAGAIDTPPPTLGAQGFVFESDVDVTGGGGVDLPTPDLIGELQTTRSIALSILSKTVGWWERDETSGTDMLDSHTNGLDGTYSGLNVNQTGLAANLGKAVQYPSGNNYSEVPHDPLLNQTGAFSILLWFRRNGAQPNFPKLLWKPAGNVSQGQANYQFYLSGSSNAYFRVNTTNCGPATINDATTYQLIGSRESGGNLELFSNNVSVDYRGGPGTPFTSGNDLRLGYNGSGLDPFVGDQDQFAIFDDVLTANERDYLYNSGDGRSYAQIQSDAGI